MSGEAEDFDLLAGIYVLGVLDPEEARAVEDLAARDPEVARSVEEWRNRLAPLTAMVPPVTPPAELWARVAESCFPAQAEADASTPVQPEPTPLVPPQPVAPQAPLRRVWRSLPVWRAAAAGFALAAAYAGLLLWSRPEPTPYAAALAPLGSPAPVFLAQLESDGTLHVRPIAQVPVAPGRDLELWALPEGAKAPVSLGVLPAIGRNLPARTILQGPVQLLVSLEPAGGSPTGQPTGPVLYGGALKRL